MTLPSYLRPWSRWLLVAAVLGAAAGVGVALRLPDADRTSGAVALVQALVLAALVWTLLYAFSRLVVVLLRRWVRDDGFARTPHVIPELFALLAVAFVAAAAVPTITWAVLGRGFVLA